VAIVLFAMMGTSVAAAAQYSAWGLAVNVESIAGTSSEFNTSFNDGCPIQSPDGLSFFMATNRPGGLGGIDIWVATRASTDDPWGPPSNLGAPVNSSADDFCPTPVPGRGLFFVSARTVSGSCGGPDIYFTRLNPTRGWGDPRNLGCQVNSAAGEAGPSYIEAGGEAFLFFSSARPGGVDDDAGPSGDSDIYVSRLGNDGVFGAAELVAELSTTFEDARPNVRKDGLEVVFDSTRTGTLPDIYSATRAVFGDAWSVPVNLGTNVNTSSSETRASFSRDGMTLYFGSNRPGSDSGSGDVYVTTRERVTGQD